MHIYFSGINGVALGPLAEIALDAGHQVSGSDQQTGPMTTRLERRGVAISTDQSGTYLAELHRKQPVDWLVQTSALTSDHPELAFARQHGIRVSKRDELLKEIILQKKLKLIAVAGTHGKTTTTGMLVWLLKQLGLPVSYSIGTTISFGPSGVFTSDSDYFIYECDEFDRNFLQFHPYLSLITSIGYDHPDTYPTADNYYEAFHDFIEQSNQTIAWQRDLEKIPTATITATTGLPDTTDVSHLTLAGQHNRDNGWLVLTAAAKLTGKSIAELTPLLNTFPGTHRRFEKLAENLYSDYGHHPVEIKATLQMARELSDHVVLVYQPHQNVRQHLIRHQYENSMNAAEMIYWLPTYLSREDASLPVLTPEELSNNLAVRERVVISDLDDSLWQHIQAERRAGSLVLCMGAGSIDAWVRQQLAATPEQNK
ncbi:MAG TPA: Mur ligase domain-containing protein [Verrucomicrobiae bacterium]|nr:Mur ligase domain-containing protein [Verrucomicrobiae bacterium]